MSEIEFYKDLLYQFENRRRNCSAAEYVHESIEKVVEELKEQAQVSAN